MTIAMSAAAANVLAGRALWTMVDGDAREQLRAFPEGCIKTTVTSPPYWRQRDYGAGPGEIGRESAPIDWARACLAVFDEVHRVTRHDGSLWLNLGEKYAAGGYGWGEYAGRRRNWQGSISQRGDRWAVPPPGYKRKDQTLAPFTLAEMLRARGWYLRQTIIWAKTTAVESPRLDRPSTSHEYLFLFTKHEHSAVRDPGEPWWRSTVWTIAPDRSSGHTAAMPRELARRCIVASSAPGELVCDPFAGEGTTPLVAVEQGRRSLGIELSPEIAARARGRIGAKHVAECASAVRAAG